MSTKREEPTAPSEAKSAGDDQEKKNALPTAASTSSERPDQKRIRIAAAAAAAAGAGVAALEISSILSPENSSPGGHWFWLLVGLGALIFGVAELFLGGRDIPKKR